ncbi:DUF3310 domain-containing protein [Mammaliicoccus sciuri]|uniref:DUF3310 domain-containing protein n=1 Tax=Mammaliicoccus sciuri TaxID=1296 RepID=UPI00211A9C59|nr:DUF3310 domain-containing protein [Mammaliicoccus sciuri]
MEFKAGDRVHVTKLNHKDVDFYGMLEHSFTDLALYKLVNCSNSDYEYETVRKEGTRLYGIEDFYTLATDEEDSEEPVIQRTTDTHDPVKKPSHYMLGDIEVKDIIAIVADKYHKGSVAHNVASALEYQMRAPEKNGLEDIKKARKCLDFAIENWE